MIRKDSTNNTIDVISNIDESEEEISPTCYNCRHNDSNLCHDYKKFKHYYKKKRGYKIDNPNSHPKNYCKFWAYQPKGMWITPFWAYQPKGLIE